MIDLSPHIAMMSADSNLYCNSNDFSSAYNGSRSNACVGLFERFTDVPTQNNLQTQYFSQINLTQVHNRTNKLVSDKPVIFQVPVMLNPGEILSIGNTNDPFIGEGNVNLHINAVVKNNNKKSYCIGT